MQALRPSGDNGGDGDGDGDDDGVAPVKLPT